VPSEIDVKVSVDYELPAGSFGDETLKLRLEYAEICRPQPREGQEDQRDHAK
jgi:hypothetical protein